MRSIHCHRCDRAFSSQRALQQHCEDSAQHNTCDDCSFDGFTWQELLDHARDKNHGVVCQGCNDGQGTVWYGQDDEYEAHLDDENVCEDCEEHFETPNNLHHHRMVHLEPSIECYGCYRTFKTYFAMIIHLESGSCASGMTVFDLNESAASHFWWEEYIDNDFRDDLLNCIDVKAEYSNPVYPFRCPECDTGFGKLSSLFQHAYSPACDQDLYEGTIGELIRWLKERHDLTRQ